MNDHELVRAFEPVIRFTDGELFFPIAVDGYVKDCSLWERDPAGEPRLLVPAGALDLETLGAEPDAEKGHSRYMQFVREPLFGLNYQSWRWGMGRSHFKAAGRMARVPLPSRLIGSLFDLSLVVRGTVPGGTTAAAHIAARTIMEKDPRHVYYYRVLRQGGWIVLHYMFFYAMNNWRSTFYGVNDHEADWEQILVYLSEDENGAIAPQWVAYASHDFHGDDLRRRWDDPVLRREGDHPVIFAGAGSHASYFEPGEYLMGTEPAPLVPVKSFLLRLRKIWTEQFGMGASWRGVDKVTAFLSIPYVDYARGDGVRVGPEHLEWSAVHIDDSVGWVSGYRGLWGLDTQDPLGGERAPSGPKYNRDGTIRRTWHDPLGWAGLDKVEPPARNAQAVAERIAGLEQERSDLDEEIAQQRAALRRLALDETALRATFHLEGLHQTRKMELAAAEATLAALQVRRADLDEVLEAVGGFRQRIDAGDWGPPGAHLVHTHRPEPELAPQPRAIEVWAALSGGVAIAAFALLVTVRPDHWLYVVAAVFAAFGAMEAILARRLSNYLMSLAIILAVITAAILLFEFWELALVILLTAVVIFVIRDNLRELGRV